MNRRWCGFDICPYGHLSWILPVVTFVATCGFLFPSFRCSLTVSKSPAGDFEIWYGYWKLESAEFAIALGPEDDSNVCIKWGGGDSREIFDGLWKLGKSIGVIGSLTTILTAALNCILFWSRLDLGWFYPLIGVHVINAFFCFMLLIGLKSELCEAVSCVLARAGYVAIGAGVLWLISAFILYSIRKLEAEMSANPTGVGLKDIEADQEKMLALPAPEKEFLALPPPSIDSPEEKKKKAPSSREVFLALPPSESPRRSSARTGSSKSPRKGTRSSTSDIETSERRPSTPRRSSEKSPKKKATMTPTSTGSKQKKPNEIPEI